MKGLRSFGFAQDKLRNAAMKILSWYKNFIQSDTL